MLLEDGLKQLPTSGSTTLWTLGFVAEAFEDLQKHIAKAVRFDKMASEDSVFTDIQPERAWETSVGIHSRYSKYIDYLYGQFVGRYLNSERRQKITNFRTFMKEFVDFSTQICYVSPVTRIGYVTSHHMNPLSSGMTIELVKGAKYDDDYGKYVGFIRDPNFNFFRRACERHGFLVDKNAPWRIFADIQNPYMQSKMRAHGIEDIEDIFPAHYLKASNHELDNLRVRCYHLYQMFLEGYPDYTILLPRAKNTSGGSTKMGVKLRDGMTWEGMNKEFGVQYWIRLAIYLRACETHTNMSQIEFENVVTKGMNYFTYYGNFTFAEYIDYVFAPDPSRVYKKTEIKNLTEEERCDRLVVEKMLKHRSSFRPVYKF